ncbi:tetratricopeptide repeat protein [Desulfovibrio inopinatus]|uniref:tetratricopeptide repeat protein n=1 Tax=Desulfovibrio inopinatus TaxID=102109 RepID=UPI000406FCEC|nr:tetratricopeptide repeat protein [Desulfovibrio inopinatus]
MTETTDVSSSGVNFVLILVVLGLVAMFAGSFTYRLSHPDLTIALRSNGAGGQGGMGQAGGMSDLVVLMGKLQEDPNDVEAMLTIAGRFVGMGAFDRAKTFMDKAATLRPDDADVLNVLGVYAFRMKDNETAKSRFEHMQELAPQDYRAYYNLGILYEYGFNDRAKAQEFFEKALTMDGIPKDTADRITQELQKTSPNS